MAPTGATSSTATGTFNKVPTSATDPTITITQGAGPTTTTLTNAATAGATNVTVSAVPTSAAATALSIVNAYGTVNMAPTGATSSSATGTFNAIPTSATAPSITITEGAGPTTTTLTTNATTSSATAAFSTAGTTSTTATIANPTTSITFTGSAATGTVTVNVSGVSGATITIGGTTYTWVTTTLTAANQILQTTGSGTTGHDDNASNLEAAINANSSECTAGQSPCFGTGTVANPDASATVSANVVTVTNTTSGSITFSTSSGTDFALSPSGSITAAVNACSSATAGTFIIGATAAASATNLYTAITSTSCQTTHPIGATASNPGGGTSFTITDTQLGYATFTAGGTGLTLTAAGGNATANGTTACTGTTGTFALAANGTVPTTALEIAQLKTALGDCSGTGLTGGTVSGSSLPVTQTALGYDPNFAVNSTQTGTFSWGAASPGSNGTANACTTPGAGTFLLAPSGILPTTSTVATQLAAAVNMCTNSGVGAGTVTANAFTVTNTVLGYSTFAGLTGIVTVSATSAGTNGTTACTFPNGTFALAASGTIPTTALEIAQLKTALTDCGAGTGVTGGTVAGSSLPVTQTALGYDPNFAVNSTQTGTFSWGAASPGSNGTANACTTPGAGTFLLAPSGILPTTSTVAAGLAAAVNLCTNSGVGAGTVTANAFTVTNTVLGYSTFAGLTGVVTVSAASAGSNGTTACTFPNGTFALANNGTTIPTTALEIAQLKTALSDCGAGTGVTGGTVTGSSLPVTDSALGYDMSLVASSSQPSIFSWTSVTYGSNGNGNVCSGTGTISGTFLLAPASTLPTTSTVASGLTTALGNCPGTAGVGFNTLSTNTFNVADTALGYATFTGLSGIVTVSPGSAGTNGSDVCSSIAGGTFAIGNSGALPTTALMASNLRTAINDCPTGTGVSASYTSGSAFTATDTSILGYDTNFTFSGNQTGVFAWTGPTYGSNGSNTCPGTTSPFSGTFELNTTGLLPTTSSMATQMAAAINMCSAAAGVSAGSVSSNTFVETDTALGSATFTGSTDLAWSGITQGSNGSGPTCSGSGPYTANYSVAQTLLGLATDVVNAINFCAGAGDISATVGANGAFTVTNTTFDSATISTATTNNTGIFSWGGVTAGTVGTSACTGNTTGTYVYNTSLATLATNLNTTISTHCTAATTGITSTTTGAPTDGILVTSETPGSTGGNNITLGGGSGIFTWNGTTLTGGTDGVTSSSTAPPTFAYWSGNTYLSQANVATNIATAFSGDTSITSATPSGDTVVVTFPGSMDFTEAAFSAFTWNPTGVVSGGAGGTVGAGQYPAKYSFSTSGDGTCGTGGTPDYVVYNTGIAGSATQANIIAYDNIYSGCSGTVPSVYWSYHTGGGSVVTSPVISLDGTKVAFIETGAPSGSATLRILQWNAGDGSDFNAPIAPLASSTNSYAGAAGNTSWSSCLGGASCMISVPFRDPSSS